MITTYINSVIYIHVEPTTYSKYYFKIIYMYRTNIHLYLTKVKKILLNFV